MRYTPAFQNIIDQIEIMADAKEPIETIREYFHSACYKIGPYERLNNLYRIRVKRPVPGEPARILQFKMNKMQDEFYKTRTNRDLILKMRQGGVTTFSCLIAFDMALWNDGVNTAIMAHVLPNVKKYFRICKTAFQQFQKDWGDLYPISSKLDNVTELVINETGSSLMVCMEAKGLTLDFLHISEAAFVDDDRISESIEAVPLSGWVIMETTPDTASGYFYDCWQVAEKGEVSLFKEHFFEWWYQYPEEQDLDVLKPAPDVTYSEKEQVLMSLHDLTPVHMLWRRLKITESKGDEGEFMRKYPEDSQTCFLSGSNSVFSTEILVSLINNERLPAFMGELQCIDKRYKLIPRDCPRDKLDVFCGYKIFEKPKEGAHYSIGADVAEGVGGDASCAQVINCKTGQHVASYWSNAVDIDTYAAELYKLAMYYNRAKLCIEQNNHGHAVIALLGGAIGALHYPNLYFRYTLDEFTQKKTKSIGFRTTQSTKPRIIENLKSALRDGETTTSDKYTTKEFGSFVRDVKSGRMGAKGKAKDDRVMAYALAWEQARIVREITDNTDENYQPEQMYDPMTGFPL